MEMEEKGVVNLGYNKKDEKQETPTSPNDVDVDVEVPPNKHLDNGNIEPVEDNEPGYIVDPKTGDYIFEKREFDKEEANSCSKAVSKFQERLSEWYRNNKGPLWILIGVILLLAFLAYVAYSIQRSGLDDEAPIRLLACTIFGILLLILHIARHKLEPFYATLGNYKTSPKYSKQRRYIQWALYVISTVVTVTLLIVLVAIDTPKNLLSLAGLAALMLICYFTSYSPAMIQWHPVFWGFSLQFYFAVIILKTRWGYQAFDWLGDRVTEFLSYSDEGAKFVFGDVAGVSLVNGASLGIKSAEMADGSSLSVTKLMLADNTSLLFASVYTIHFFAFKVVPVVIFFSSFIAVMFYLGVMKFVVKNIGHFLSFCLGTTPAESLNAAGNIFVGMTESPLMIRPFIGKMTSSELHAVMVGGFATIAGSVLGVYIGFGVSADHLLSASVMSAPAALAISKITYPEIEKPVLSAQNYEKMENSGEGNLIQAACNGASLSGKICASIIVNVIAFLSLLKFVNATLTWFGDRAGVENLTFELICSYVLYPVALFMGTDVDDCRRVAELIGVKTFTNEFIAFSKLSVMLNNRKEFIKYTAIPNNTWHNDGNDIYLHNWNNKLLEKGILEPRSEVIATYALCGFSNFGSVGIFLGGLSALAPHRTPTMSRLVMRAMVAGNIACFFTACIAGLFYEEFD